jgi:hypothetical protein
MRWDPHVINLPKVIIDHNQLAHGWSMRIMDDIMTSYVKFYVKMY